MTKFFTAVLVLVTLLIPTFVSAQQYVPPPMQVGYIGLHAVQPEFHRIRDYNSNCPRPPIVWGGADYPQPYDQYPNQYPYPTPAYPVGQYGYPDYGHNPSYGYGYNYGYPRQGLNRNETRVLNTAIIATAGVAVGKTVLETIQNRSDNKRNEKMAYLQACINHNELACDILANKEGFSRAAITVLQQSGSAPAQQVQPSAPQPQTVQVPVESSTVSVTNATEDTLELTCVPTGNNAYVQPYTTANLPSCDRWSGKLRTRKGSVFDATYHNSASGVVFTAPEG